MYVPTDNDERQLPVLHGLIERHPLGTWMVVGPGGTEVNHLPFLLKPQRGPHGTLLAHVARANPVWQMEVREAVVCFHGPQAYISPGWYPSKASHGKAVPTWNYAVVHAHGRCRFIHDRDWLHAHVRELSAHFEAGMEKPWSIDEAPTDFIEHLLGGIVGVEIQIERLIGKLKTSRSRSATDKASVIRHLVKQGGDDSMGLAKLMRHQMAIDLPTTKE